MPGVSSLDLPAATVAVVPGPSCLSTVLKRDGRAVPFDRERIVRAIEMAFRAEHGTPYPDPLALLVYDQVEQVTDSVIASLTEHVAPAETVEIERIQDEVERQLMAHEYFNVARRYILYREARAQRRDGRRLRIRDPRHGETILEAAVVRIASRVGSSGSTPDCSGSTCAISRTGGWSVSVFQRGSALRTRSRG